MRLVMGDGVNMELNATKPCPDRCLGRLVSRLVQATAQVCCVFKTVVKTPIYFHQSHLMSGSDLTIEVLKANFSGQLAALRRTLIGIPVNQKYQVLTIVLALR